LSVCRSLHQPPLRKKPIGKPSHRAHSDATWFLAQRNPRDTPQAQQSKDAWIGAGVGAIAGISLGASSNSASCRAGAFFGGISGGLPGAPLGGAVPIFHHKQVIYKRWLCGPNRLVSSASIMWNARA